MLQKSAAIPAILSCLVLTACGSSGGGGSANVSQINLGEPPVFADGTQIVSSDFLGETFPFYFVEGFRDGSATTLRRGVGSATVSGDGNSLVLQIGDNEFVDLSRVSGTTFDTGNGIEFLVEDLFVSRTVSINDPALFGSADLAGGFGFQTPSSQMPTSNFGFYDVESFSRLILTRNGSPEITSLDSVGGVDLVANFSNRTIAGTLFNGSGFADIDGDNFVDDELVFFVELENGTISGGTFSGTLSGDAVAFIDDVDFFDLNPTFSGTRADGVFFGNGATAISGTYEGDFRSQGPDGSFVGYFDVGLD